MIEFDLHENQFTGQIPNEINNLQGLIYINIGDNAFTGTIPASFSDLQQLDTMSLDTNLFSGSVIHTNIPFLTIN